ncbi:MAG: universal stress protein [Betaproteobacteria bacterium]|jgi:nucleotide-binding universal stress UspA family protein|nr:universal stress protein [Betaproteobacteria bacterium]MDH5343980.1 universal stress protein [Betaproteobacteria bacterium]
MFKNVLIYTDGSKLSRKALVTGIKLAKMSSGKVTLLYVLPRLDPMIFAEGYVPEPDWMDNYESTSRDSAKAYLARAEVLASKSGVPCATRMTTADRPYKEIIATARNRKCDAIVMPSRGRKGMTAVLLGSETMEVLTRCTRPVIVVR